MSGRLLVGTVRARRGGMHVVVTPNRESGGEDRLYVRFEGPAPSIGVDVIGRLDESGPQLSMRVVPNVTREILKGRVEISTHGRSDLTARMLGRVLGDAGPGALAPGTGGFVERTPTMSDPDAAWAFKALGAKAADLGIALNVVEPLAVAGREWSDRRLVDDLLPADSIGERDALADMKSIFFGGMPPACRRTFVDLGRGLVPSVDFIVPYSPFMTGAGYSARISKAYRDELPRVPLPGEYARKIASWREMVLPFAHRYLGRRKPTEESNRQVEQTFADVSAAIALTRDFGEDGRNAALVFSRLREAAVARYTGVGAPPVGSHLAIGVALQAVHGRGSDLEADLGIAASVARQYAPSNAKDVVQMATQADGDAFVRIDRASPAQADLLSQVYADDVREVAARLSPNPAALERFSRFSVLEVPIGWEEVFDHAVAPFVDGVEAPRFCRDEGVDLVGAASLTF